MVLLAVVLCALGAVFAVLGTSRLLALNPGRAMRFRFRAAKVPVRSSPSALVLQALSPVCLAGAALTRTHTTLLPWFALFVVLVAVFNLLPRAVVLARHNRRLRRPTTA